MREVNINGAVVGNGQPFLLFAGPCVIESEKMCLENAKRVRGICESLDIPFVFKASFDKANRSSIASFRGLGRDQGLRILKKIRDHVGVPIVTDVHSIEDVEELADVIDVLQIPAFLCRQTDLIMAAAHTGKTLNIKKGQFLAPWDVRNIIDKVTSTGNRNIIITERGSSFGYNNLVVDFKGLPIIRQFGYPVCFDATHSVQLPGGAGTSSGGQREFVFPLLRAALAVGVDAVFMEVHEDPDNALSDGPNMLPIDELYEVLKNAKLIDGLVKKKLMV